VLRGEEHLGGGWVAGGWVAGGWVCRWGPRGLLAQRGSARGLLRVRSAY
jgi:hypothetical protein